MGNYFKMCENNVSTINNMDMRIYTHCHETTGSLQIRTSSIQN